MARRDLGRRTAAKASVVRGGNGWKKTGEWFRMGIVSATLIAPLIARWNDLRLMERATKLGKEVGGLADAQARELPRLAAERAGDWSVVAADRARALGDQALSLSDDLLALASGRADDLRKQATSRLEGARRQFLETKAYDTLKGAIPVVAKLDNRKSQRNATTFWVVGALVGLVAATGAFLIIRARLRAAPQEPLVELPREGATRTNSGTGTVGTQGTGTQTAGRGPAATVSGALSGLRAVAERRGIQSMRDIDTARDANAAPIVGNIHTMVYHDATDRNLPSEENRVYFANEAEARAQGFRPAQPTAVEHNEGQSQSQSSRP